MRPTLEGAAGSYIYRVPSHEVVIRCRSVRLHSDGRLTATMRIMSEATGQRIPGSGTINLAAANTRGRFAKELEVEYPIEGWNKILDDLYIQLEDKLIEGEPWLALSSDEYPGPIEYLLPPLLPENEPTIIYGDGESGKSMFAMLVGIMVATGLGHSRLGLNAPKQHNVLYLDWERSPHEAKRRLYRLAKGMGLQFPAQMKYRKCSMSLADDIESVAAAVHDFDVGLLIIDSLLPASRGEEGRDPAGPAGLFFEALRKLDATSFVVAHQGKDKEKGIYGSVFFRNLSSSIWRARSTMDIGNKTVSIGLFHDKANISGRLNPFGVEFSFDDSDKGSGPIHAYRVDVAQIPEVGENAPLGERISSLLKRRGKLTVKDIQDELEVPANHIRARLSDMQRRGIVVKDTDDRWGMLVQEVPF